MATGRQIIVSALEKLNATSSNSVPTDEDIQLGLNALNALIDSKSNDFLNIHQVNPFRFRLEAGKQSYSLGPTGDWIVERPMRMEKARLMMNPIFFDQMIPYTAQIHPDSSTTGDMQYRDAYAAFIGSTAFGGINAYWEANEPNFTAPGATFSEPTSQNTFKNVTLAQPNTTTFTAQGGLPIYENGTIEWKIGDLYSQNVVVAIQFSNGLPNSSNDIFNQNGSLIFWASQGYVGTTGAVVNLPGTPVAAPSYTAGDVVGIVFKRLTGGAQQAGFFKNGVLVYTTEPDAFFISPGSGSYSWCAGTIQPNIGGR